jgi:dimethylargininase
MSHLKSGMSYLEDNNLLVQNGLFNHPAFNKFRKIKVGTDEGYSANSLWVNDTVLVPAGFPITRNKI